MENNSKDTFNATFGNTMLDEVATYKSNYGL